ncbi:hypothetical protein NQ315_004294 [Exocentrus adspersus]|uniref:Uncharacterized protein n=1 Tax=Exocentrus adspersus TaxID=1586481 RepID=A0AAV8W6Z9_9CUCU|nr:hypothetical protein NQ315_004294 [Exocentrus adspersus]
MCSTVERTGLTKMKTVPLLLTALGLALLSTHSLGCETNCCNSSDCCDNSTDCCKNTECNSSSCCQTTSNCCQKVTKCYKACRAGCRTSSCANNCNDKCCQNECNNNDDDIDKDKIIERPNGSTSNVNENNITFTPSITVNNTINTENRVHIPIIVSNSNINNVVVVPADNTQPTTPCSTTNCTTPEPTTPCPPPVTIRVPVPIPVPGKPIFIPIFHPVPYPVPQPGPGCCVTINPCISQGCQRYQTSCGSSCPSPYTYKPINPCEGVQCYRRPFCINRYCEGSGYCQDNWINCSQCGSNFYQNFESYRQCGGCFYR